jgi:hypothetical protein
MPLSQSFGENEMTNTIIGFVTFLLSIITFSALVFTGFGAVLAGHLTLALLLVCMYGMWLGAYIISKA